MTDHWQDPYRNLNLAQCIHKAASLRDWVYHASFMQEYWENVFDQAQLDSNSDAEQHAWGQVVIWNNIHGYYVTYESEI